MSMDPNAPYQPPGSQSGPPQKGGGSKLMLGVGIGCGLVLLLCCGGGVAMFMIGKSAIQIETTPAQVSTVAQGVTDMDVPAGFEPKMSMAMKVPFVNKKIMTMALYAGPNEKGMIMVADFGQEMAGNGPEQMKMQIEQSMRQQQQQGQGAQNLQMEGEPKEIKITVRGQESTFKIQKGKTQNGEEFLQVEGTFPGKEGPGVLIGQLPASDFSEEDAEAFVKSIK
jgi:hypothetical protein